MEDRKRHPSLPSNYVSLAQLQERWLKEQQRKQREKEEEEERKQRQKEEEDRKREDQEIRRQKQIGERSSDANSVSKSRWPFQKNRRNQSDGYRRTIDVSKSKSEESQIETVVVNDEEQKTDESKKREKKKWKKNTKPRAEENPTGGMAQLAPANEPEVKIRMVVAERHREKESIRDEFRRNGDPLGVNVNIKAWERKVSVDQKLEIGRKFDDLSLDGGKEGNVRSKADVHGGHCSYGGSGRFNHRKMWKQSDCNLVWVKKGESSETNIAEIRSSGSLVKSGEGKKKNPGKGKQKEINWKESKKHIF